MYILYFILKPLIIMMGYCLNLITFKTKSSYRQLFTIYKNMVLNFNNQFIINNDKKHYSIHKEYSPSFGR